MSDEFHVLVCSNCSEPWIQPVDEWSDGGDYRAQGSVTCPHCGTEHAPSKVKQLKCLPTREAAGEWRARYLAKRADEASLYNDFALEWGQYGEQLAEIDRQIDSFTLDADLMDLRPIGADRYQDLVDESIRRHRERFGLLADEWVTDPKDEFADLVSSPDPTELPFAEYVDDTLEGWADRADRDELARGELTVTTQQPADMAGQLELADRTVTDLWQELFDYDRVRSALAESITETFGGMDSLECYDVLEEYGVPFWIRSHIVNVARGYASDAVAIDGPADPRTLVDDVIAPLPDSPLASVDDLLAVASLFDGLESEPVVAVVVRDAFVDDVRRDQRVDVCDLLAILADSLDLRLVGSTVTLAKLGDSHRSSLPGVSEWCNRHRDAGELDPAQQTLAQDLSENEFAATMLRALAREPNGVLSYSNLYALYPGGNDSRVRQIVGEFVDAELLERFGPRTDRKVELLPAGERVLEHFEREIASQRRISDFVSAAGKQQQQCRVPTRTGVGGGGDVDPATAEGTRPYSTAYMTPAEHAGTAGCGQTGDVTLVRGEIRGYNDRTRYVSYDPKRDEAVVAVRAGGPMEMTVSAALALASPEFVDRALPVTRLESIDDPPEIVRDARCIGGASTERLEDGQEFRDMLVEWGEELAGMTTKLRKGDLSKNRSKFCADIIRSAQGLWGTMTHLLDLFEIDVHREIRVPAGLSRDKLEDLATSIGYAAAIQSTYNGHYACFRQLFEDRKDKRRSAFTAQVDAANPTGSLIGSFVIRGPDVHRLEDDLRDRLESPREVHEDAPEFGVGISVRTEPTRDAFDDAVRRVLSRKNIRTTTAAVSVVHALAATPHDAAVALHRHLSPEDSPREVRPDELRTALSTLPAHALLPTVGGNDRRTTSAGKIVKALLEADEPLAKGELADRAEVSKKTVYNYRTELETLGIITVDAGEYRCRLSFATPEGRAEPLWPTFVDRTFTEAIDALLVETLPAHRYGDPDDPIGGLLFWSDGDPPNPWALLENDKYRSWAEFARRLTGAEQTRPSEKRLLMGPGIKQQPIIAEAQSLPTGN